jgi:hypothetical protein
MPGWIKKADVVAIADRRTERADSLRNLRFP